VTRPRVLVFDLDDTLYPERDYVRSGFRAAARWLEGAHGVPAAAFFDACWGLFEGGLRGSTFDEALARLDARGPGVVAGLVAAYREHEPEGLTLFDDARDALDRFGARGPLGLITDGPLGVQRAKARALGVEPRFAAPVYSDALGGRDAWKPSPRPFLEVMRVLDAAGADCAYVADNPRKDFKAPRALGWRTVRVRRAGGEHALAEPEGPEWAADVELATLDALDDALG
jgi:putative hydrolase of the HAD superfamily